MNAKLMKSISIAHPFKSQWDWGDNEWFMHYIAQIWSLDHRFPVTEAELDAIDLQEVRRGYEQAKQAQVSVTIRGLTLEEGWIAAVISSKKFFVCLRNADIYWPADRIPQMYKKNFSLLAIWTYIELSSQEYIAKLPHMTQLHEPFGPLGVFLGNVAHSIVVLAVDSESQRLFFKDSWQKGTKPSLLADGQNHLGLKARKEDKDTWSITREEFMKTALCFEIPKISYDYYSSIIRDPKFKIEKALNR